MIIEKIEIKNFRCFREFTIDLNGKSVVLVSENAAGKTSLLVAIAKALGKDRTISFADFAEPEAPIEIIVSLSGFERADQGIFPKELSFTSRSPSLRIGFKAEWNTAEEEASIVCGFPDHGWRGAAREQRDALPLMWLPAYRDPKRLLQMNAVHGFWPNLFAAAKIDPALGIAAKAVYGALSEFVATEDVARLFGQLRDTLAGLIPDVDKSAFTLGLSPGASQRDLLNEFEVLLSHGGPRLPVLKQSNGLVQLAVFVFALRVVAHNPKVILLLDEPEISLHPQAQRSLATSFRVLPNQSILATHSPSILDRADLRKVVRLFGEKGAITATRAAALTDSEASRLARFVNPLTAEACFARKVVLVEGYSDRVALLCLAIRMGSDFDAQGVTIIAMDGGSGLGTYLRLFGTNGLKLEVLGMCDEDKETRWLEELRKAGMPVTDRASMRALGFVVCVKDLEHEFVKSLGLAGAQAVIAAEGEGGAFARFQKQPAHSDQALDEQLRRFFKADKTRWAVPLTEALNLKAIPGPLNDIISKLREGGSSR